MTRWRLEEWTRWCVGVKYRLTKPNWPTYWTKRVSDSILLILVTQFFLNYHLISQLNRFVSQIFSPSNFCGFTFAHALSSYLRTSINFNQLHLWKSIHVSQSLSVATN